MHGNMMDGTLLPHLYVLVSDLTVHFPANMIMNLPNIKAFASKSANMTKRDLKVFLEQAMWPLKYFFWLIPGQPTKMTNYTTLQSLKVMFSFSVHTKNCEIYQRYNYGIF